MATSDHLRLHKGHQQRDIFGSDEELRLFVDPNEQRNIGRQDYQATTAAAPY